MKEYSFKEKTPLKFHNIFKYYILLMIFRLELVFVLEIFLYNTTIFQVSYYLKIVILSISIINILSLILASFGLFRFNRIFYYAFTIYFLTQALNQILRVDFVAENAFITANYLNIIIGLFINGLILYYYSKRKHIFNGKLKDLFSFGQGNKVTYCRKCGAKISSQIDKECSKCGTSGVFNYEELSKRING